MDSKGSNSNNTDAGAGGSNTTFVQADPSTFRAVVQRLTGPDDPDKLPLAAAAHHRRPPFKLHERRQTGAIPSLDTKLGGGGRGGSLSPAQGRSRGMMMMAAAASPVSPLDLFSPKTPSLEGEEERRAIAAEKGFYRLQPSPLSTPRRASSSSSSDVPELLPLFPLTSPTTRDCSTSSSSSSSP